MPDSATTPTDSDTSATGFPGACPLCSAGEETAARRTQFSIGVADGQGGTSIKYVCARCVADHGFFNPEPLPGRTPTGRIDAAEAVALLRWRLTSPQVDSPAVEIVARPPEPRVAGEHAVTVLFAEPVACGTLPGPFAHEVATRTREVLREVGMLTPDVEHTLTALESATPAPATGGGDECE